MKKNQAIAIGLILMMVFLAGCGSGPEADGERTGEPISSEAVSGDAEQIKIVATLFPQYDFAREIAGDKAEVTLLLPPGVESHSYEPTPSDLVKINNADLFLYTGKYMEAWAQKIIDSVDDTDSPGFVLDVTEGIRLSHHEESEEAEENHQDYDPHVWTDPLLAKIMVSNIELALCKIDPANAQYYRENAEAYRGRLDSLDAEFRSIVKNGARKKILFGSRFALYYFAEEYQLDYAAAFDSCSSETEPSAKTVAGLMDEIEKEKIPVIYYAELEDPKIAAFISEETGAKMLLLHSCHNISKRELEEGETYLSLMEQNAMNLEEGLK